MGERILNQPWEDVADDVTGAIEKAVQPLLRKATDDIYTGLLEATQDYLKDNLAFNIASRIDAAEREARRDRERCQQLVEASERLLHDINDLMANSEGVAGLHLNGDMAPWSDLDEEGHYSPWLGQGIGHLRDAIAKACGEAA